MPASPLLQVEFEDITFTKKVPVRDTGITTIASVVTKLARKPAPMRTHAVLQVCRGPARWYRAACRVARLRVGRADCTYAWLSCGVDGPGMLGRAGTGKHDTGAFLPAHHDGERARPSPRSRCAAAHDDGSRGCAAAPCMTVCVNLCSCLCVGVHSF